MPGINPDSDAFTITFLRDLDQRVRALETQQNSVWRDPEGNPRLQLGLLPNGDFGAAVYDASGSGTYAELHPPKAAEVIGSVSTSTITPPQDLGGPYVEATIGATGSALVVVSCQTFNDTAGDFANVDLMVDGSLLNGGIVEGSTQHYQSGAGIQIVTGLTPGTRTFQLYYSALVGGTAWFQQRSLVVWPL